MVKKIMLETFIEFVHSVPWYWVLLFGFFITYLENIFPPSPSDAVVVVMGALVGSGDVGFIQLLIATTLGSTAGFLTMFWLGIKFEKKIVESNKIRFVSRKSLEKVGEWFQKWGYWMIVANRFLSGTRAVIAFFAGMSELSVRKSAVLSFLSALLWNSILIYLGYVFGENWEEVYRYMNLYGYIIAPTVVLIVLAFIAYKYFENKRAGNKV